MAKRYGRASQESVRKAMSKRKRGTLRSGRSGRKVTSRRQAVAIGLSEAREKGARVPLPPGGRKRSSSRKRGTTKRGASKRSTSKATSKRGARRRSSRQG